MKQNKYRFQITVDSDSIFISKSTDSNKSRVTLSNLDHNAMAQLAKSIIDSDLIIPFEGVLETTTKPESAPAKFYSFYLGFDNPLQDLDHNKLNKVLLSFSPSYTLINAEGTFEETNEHTIIIQIGLNDKESAEKCAEILIETFDQKAVGFICLGEYFRVLNH